ncbi:hypothetical protein GJ744_009778 [Endocarpon pusillum]|uniref:Uncharacterized protein n=1 Tax=Endocarpon pusillum TaxID=364733 RepID=A0A8H7E8N8_9EURO|nr:hypothetical protein GJ744_009778 [Endocarpon pusillum]
MFPIKTEQTRSRRGSRADSGYGESISVRTHRSNSRSRRRSNSRGPPPPPSSFPQNYRSNADFPIVRDQSFPPSSHGGDRSSQANEYFNHWQQGVEMQNRPPGSSCDDRYSGRDDQSTYERHYHREPHPACDNSYGDRSNQSNGDLLYERSNSGRRPNSSRGGGDQDIPHRSHFDNNETSAPRAPAHQEGLSIKDKEFADAVGKGIGTMIKAMARDPKTIHAVSITTEPEIMKFKMKTERVCYPCNEWIGTARFWSKCLLQDCKKMQKQLTGNHIF